MLVVFIPDFQYCFEVGNKETWLLIFFSHTGGDDCDCERLKPLPKSRSALRYHFSGTSSVRRACVENMVGSDKSNLYQRQREKMEQIVCGQVNINSRKIAFCFIVPRYWGGGEV